MSNTRKRNYKRAILGDIFEFEAARGLAYGQFIYNHKVYGPFVRIFQTAYLNRPKDINVFTTAKTQFLAFYNIRSAVVQGVSTIIGTLPIPDEYKVLPPFKNFRQVLDKNKQWTCGGCWTVIPSLDEDKIETIMLFRNGLPEKYYDYPENALINHPILLKRFNEGWTARSIVRPYDYETPEEEKIEWKYEK
jgi:hypothetical protein